MPELAELSTDEEARVKVRALHTVVDLLDELSPTCKSTQVRARATDACVIGGWGSELLLDIYAGVNKIRVEIHKGVRGTELEPKELGALFRRKYPVELGLRCHTCVHEGIWH